MVEPCPELNDFYLNRNQYLKNRILVRDNFRDSTYEVTMSPDITAYPNYQGVYSKAFVGHTGYVGLIGPLYPNQADYKLFIDGIVNKNQANIDFICNKNRKLVDPYCIWDTEVFGIFRSAYLIPPAPSPTSAHACAELVELYAMALLRDANINYFSDIVNLSSNIYKDTVAYLDGNPIMKNILNGLNEPNIKDYLGAPVDPISGEITYNTLFRGNAVGDLVGPYISQFLYYNVGMGALFYRQQYRCYSNTCLEGIYGKRPTDGSTPICFNESDKTGQAFWQNVNGILYLGNTSKTFLNDYVKTPSEFVTIWNGGSLPIHTSPVPCSDCTGSTPCKCADNTVCKDCSGIYYNTPVRYISTFRDGAMNVLRDLVWQYFYTAATILITCPNYDPTAVGKVSKTNYGVPVGFFVDGRVGSRFVSLGQVDLFTLLAQAGKNSMDSCWLWKYSQMKLRPEEMAYQVDIKKRYGFGLDFSSNLLNNIILKDISNNNNGYYLLPQVFNNGSPNHPSYPSGHATYAGAMSTIIKAWFNCDSSMNAYQSAELYPALNSGNSTSEFTKQEFYISENTLLTVEGEINKLASNCAILRNIGGVHYRTDAEAGLRIGELVAIKTLEDWVQNYTNNNIVFRFRLRDGTKYEISKTYSGPTSSNVYIWSTPRRLTNGPIRPVPIPQPDCSTSFAPLAPRPFAESPCSIETQTFTDVNYY